MTQNNPNMQKLNTAGNANSPVQIDASELDFLECECGSVLFESGFRLGKLSKLHPDNPTGKDMIVPEGPYWCCKGCGKIQTQSKVNGK